MPWLQTNNANPAFASVKFPPTTSNQSNIIDIEKQEKSLENTQIPQVIPTKLDAAPNIQPNTDQATEKKISFLQSSGKPQLQELKLNVTQDKLGFGGFSLGSVKQASDKPKVIYNFAAAPIKKTEAEKKEEVKQQKFTEIRQVHERVIHEKDQVKVHRLTIKKDGEKDNQSWEQLEPLLVQLIEVDSKILLMGKALLPPLGNEEGQKFDESKETKRYKNLIQFKLSETKFTKPEGKKGLQINGLNYCNMHIVATNQTTDKKATLAPEVDKYYIMLDDIFIEILKGQGVLIE